MKRFTWHFTQSFHHPLKVLLAQFSLHVHKGGLKLDSFHFIYLALHKATHTPFYIQNPYTLGKLCYFPLLERYDHLHAKLYYLNFHPLEFVSSYPQLQVGKNTNLRPNIYDSY